VKKIADDLGAGLRRVAMWVAGAKADLHADAFSYWNLADKTVTDWQLNGTVLPGSPTDFGKLIADETEKWARVIRAANIKPE